MIPTWTPNDDQRLVLSHLREHPEGVTVAEIARWWGKGRQAAENTLASLYTHGAIDRRRDAGDAVADRRRGVRYVPLAVEVGT